jgi:O-antigen/teichoic acid export membrane protein
MLFLFGQSLLRAEDEFGTLSGALSVTALLELGATIACVYLFGFSGVLLALVLSQSVGALLCLRGKRSHQLRLEVNPAIIRKLIRIGFPIMLTILGYFVLTTIDRLLIIAFAGSVQLGYYSLGSLAITAIGYIPIAVNQVMYPKFAQRYGETGDPAALSGYLRIPAITIAHGMGLVLGLAALSLPLVTVVLPEYSPGIHAAQILLAGFFFIAITGSSSNLLLTVNRQSEYVAILGGAIALVVILDITVLSMGLGIEAVAAATAATNMLYAIVLILFTIRKHLPSGSKPFGPMLVKLFLPWFLALLLTIAATNIGTGDVVMTVILQLLAFAAVYTPVSLLILRRERIW